MHVTAQGAAKARLPVGARYCVVEIYAEYSNVSRLRVEDPDGIPVLIAATDLELVDSEVPAGWQVELTDWALIVGPKAWREPGFWDRFFDDEPAAVGLYSANRCACGKDSSR